MVGLVIVLSKTVNALLTFAGCTGPLSQLAEGAAAGLLGVRQEAEGDLGCSAQCDPELPTGRDQGTLRSVLRPR